MDPYAGITNHHHVMKSKLLAVINHYVVNNFKFVIVSNISTTVHQRTPSTRFSEEYIVLRKRDIRLHNNIPWR